MSEQPQTNGKAVAALVLGILSLVIPVVGVILGIISIILGKKAMNAIDRNGGAGRGMALAGFVCGIIGVAIWALYFLLGILGAVAMFQYNDDTNVNVMAILNIIQ